MIDEAVLMMLMNQLNMATTILDCESNLEKFLNLAHACEEYGKSQCAAGEWLEYPKHKPEIGKHFLVEKDMLFSSDQKLYVIFYWEKCQATDEQWEKVKRFAEIRS